MKRWRQTMIEEKKDVSRKMNWTAFLVLVILMFVMLCYFDRAIAADTKTPEAVKLAGEVTKAMGGADAWKKMDAIRFDFRVEHEGAEPRAVKHLWDRKGFRDHIEYKNKEGKNMVMWVNLSTKKGEAWSDGKKLEGDELNKAMETAYGRWVNDTYWLIMPLKWMDSGVNLKTEPDKGGDKMLHVSFNTVGLTPGDQYWIYINPKTMMLDKWEYLLEGEKEKEMWTWTDWTDIGGVKLSKLKTSSDGKTKIHFEPLQSMTNADPSYFSATLKTLQ